MIDFDFNNFSDILINDFYRFTFEIIITKRCNSNCPHCFMEGNQDGTITKDIIDIALKKCKQLKDDNWIELFGGEPMLEPELCAYTAQKAHEMGLKVSIYTNGYWGNSEDLMKIVCDEIKPEHIILSIDDFHTIPDSSIMNILNYFNNDKTPEVGISAVKNHCKRLDKFKELFPRLNVYYVDLHEVGKSSSHDKNFGDYCRIEGWIICPDGEVRMACEKGYKACCAGNIKDLDIVEAYNKIKDIFLLFDGNYLYEFCNQNKINIFDDSIYKNENVKIIPFSKVLKHKKDGNKWVLSK